MEEYTEKFFSMKTHIASKAVIAVMGVVCEGLGLRQSRNYEEHRFVTPPCYECISLAIILDFKGCH